MNRYKPVTLEQAQELRALEFDVFFKYYGHYQKVAIPFSFFEDTQLYVKVCTK